MTTRSKNRSRSTDQTPGQKKKKRVVLTSVIVQPVLVAVSDRGKVVEELPEQPPKKISAAAWPDYPAALSQMIKTAERQLNTPAKAPRKRPVA